MKNWAMDKILVINNSDIDEHPMITANRLNNASRLAIHILTL